MSSRLRALGVAAVVGGVALARVSGVDLGGVPYPYKLFLPSVGRSVPAVPPVPRPTPLVLRPSTERELADAVGHPGMVVVPVPGFYRIEDELRLAANTTLDGGGAVELRGHGVLLRDAPDSRVAGLRIVGAEHDGITVINSPGAIISDVAIGGSADGEIDITHTVGTVIVQRAVLHGHKCMLIGHPFDTRDRGLVVILRTVTFAGCYSRDPKAHFARVSIQGGLVLGWYTGIDVQKGAVVDVADTQFRPSARVWRWRTYVEPGSTYTERRSPQLPADDELWHDALRRSGLERYIPEPRGGV